MTSRAGRFTAGIKLGHIVDAVSDASVMAFAAWTVLALAGMTFHLPVDPLLWVWAVSLLPIAIVSVGACRRRYGDGGPDAPHAGDLEEDGAGAARAILASAALVAGLVGALLVTNASGNAWFAGWAFGFTVIVAGLIAQIRWPRWITPPTESGEPVPGLAAIGHVVAFLVSTGAAVLSLFIFRVDADDAYYVNRSSAVRDLGHIPIRDVLVSHEQLRPVGGTGAPVDAVGPLAGALARLFHTLGPTIMYFVFTPVATFLAAWALWRLVRHWAPRRPLLCYIVAIVYISEAGIGRWSFGNISITRIWQGKVVFTAWMVATLLVYLTVNARRPSPWVEVLLIAGGITSIGLTITATYDVPLLMAAGLLPVVATRRWRLALTPIAVAVVVFAIGYTASRYAPPSPGQIEDYAPPIETFSETLGFGAVAGIAAFVWWNGYWFVRDRVAQLITTGVGLLTMLTFAPGLFTSVHAAIGIGGALRRVMWIAPIPTLVGLLAAAPSPAWPQLSRRASQAVALVVPVAVVVSLLTFGTSILHARYGGTKVVSHPTWKLEDGARKQALEIVSHPGLGIVLAPSGTMYAIAIVSGDVLTVNPRTFYLVMIPQPKRMLQQRLLLTRFADRGIRHAVDVDRVKTALRDLKVGTVCLSPRRVAAIALLTTLGYRSAFAVDGLQCHRRSSASAIALAWMSRSD